MHCIHVVGFGMFVFVWQFVFNRQKKHMFLNTFLRGDFQCICVCVYVLGFVLVMDVLWIGGGALD